MVGVTEAVPVDGICVECRRVGVHRVSPDHIRSDTDVDWLALEASDLTSFEHPCWCSDEPTWHNPVAVLTGLLRSERGDGS